MLNQGIADFVCPGFAHIQYFEFSVLWKGCPRVVEKPFDGPWVTGGNLYLSSSRNYFLEAGILAGRHFAKIRDAFEACSGLAEPL